MPGCWWWPLLAGHAARNRRRGAARAPALHWQHVVLEGLLRLVPAFCRHGAAAGAARGRRRRGLATNALDLCLQLALVLMLVRAGVYLVGLLLGPRSWLHNWEPQVTLFLWLVIAFHLVGWFSDVEARLDDIDLLPGKTQFTSVVAAEEPGGHHGLRAGRAA